MGAISIFLSRSGSPDPGIVRRMLEAAPHRGSVQRVEVVGLVSVATCNDPDWTTATVARDERRTVVFCGALDNERELRTDLRLGRSPEPGGETTAATLLAAWERWGEAAVRRLRGSYAAAVTDGREVRCFRDHFGCRPLFHHDGPDGFYAATEVKQVLAGAPISSEPDLDYLHGLLFGGLDRSTAFRGVERIPKQVIVTVGPEPGVDVERYWNPDDHVETWALGPREAVEGTVEMLDRAVERTLTGRDVILLSGGLDSPALAAFADSEGPDTGPVRALTAVYPDYPSADELEWTEKVAYHLDMPLDTYVADAGSMDDVEHWVEVLDGPIDVVSIPESAEAYSEARKLGARTVLNGEIAEMLFENRAYLLDHLLSHGRLRAAAGVLRDLRSSGRSWLQILRQILRAVAPGWVLTAYRNRISDFSSGLPAWVEPNRMERARSDAPVWSTGPRRRWRRMQAAPFRGPGIGFEADEICAAICGVDSRRPFADVDLWEFVLGLPAEVKFSGRRTKPLLRDAVRGHVPDEIIDRKDKTYFDEFHLAKADYPKLRALVVESEHSLEGIDYDLLADRLEGEGLSVYELQWARNVARVHAFLDRW